MNGCPYNVPSFNFAPRPIVPRRVSNSSGVSFTVFLIFALLMLFLMSEVYTYSRKVCLDHQRRMRAMCISHQVALDAKLRKVCTSHQKLIDDRLEEVRCKCECERKCEENEEEEFCDEEDENDFEEVEGSRRLCPIPEEPSHFDGFKTD